MKVLITGGTGFIGTYFVRELKSKGHEIVVLDLYPAESDDEGLFQDVKFIRGDVRDPNALRKSIEGCDRVLHLAAAHHDFGIKDATFESVNVEAAQLICDAMDQVGIKDVCFYSTVAVYGSAQPPLDEMTPPQPASPYGQTKLGGEGVFEKWTQRGDKRQCLVIRPTVTFGAGNFANMFTLIKQIDKGGYLPVGAGDNIKSLSYIENILDATIKMWTDKSGERPAFEVFNYVCKPDLTSGEIAECIYTALGKKQPKLRVPYLLARFLALPFDAVIKVTGINLPISGARIMKLAKAETKFESEKIRKAGYEQRVSLREGIQKMVAWYQERGKREGEQGIKRRLPPEQPYVDG